MNWRQVFSFNIWLGVKMPPIWSTLTILFSSGAAFIGRDRNLLKDIDKNDLIANISDLGKQDIDRKSVSSVLPFLL